MENPTSQITYKRETNLLPSQYAHLFPWKHCLETIISLFFLPERGSDQPSKLEKIQESKSREDSRKKKGYQFLY